MKKRKLLIIALLSFVLLGYKNVYAFDSSSYRNRALCDTY